MDPDSLHQHLDGLLKLRQHSEREGANGLLVQRFLRQTLLFVRAIMTEGVFLRAMKTGDDGDGLLLLANRIQLLEPVLDSNWPCDFTFKEIVSDLFNIANGDAPRIIKSSGKQGQFRNAHALLELKLDAHAWYKVLGRLGLKASERQLIIIEGYGVTLDAFNKWRREAKTKLSSDYVERYLVTAVDAKLFEATMKADPMAWAGEQARIAGASYKQELRHAAA
jgi:hypothetical protein